MEETEIQAPSIDDTLQATLAEIQSRDNEQRHRDESGRFSAKATEEGEPTLATDTDAQSAEKPPAREAPASWTKEAKELYATLDSRLQDEIDKREQDFHKGIEGYKSKAEFADAFGKVIAPYSGTIQQLGITPDAAVATLLQAEHQFRHGTPEQKQALLLQLAQDYGIEIPRISAEGGNTLPADPMVSALRQEIQQLKGWATEQERQREAMEQKQAADEIARFQSEHKPEHYEQVRDTMAGLLLAGKVSSLKEAYDQAIWMNPTIRQALLTKRDAEVKAEQAKVAAEAKRAAATNIKPRGNYQAAGKVGSIDETLRTVAKELGMFG